MCNYCSPESRIELALDTNAALMCCTRRNRKKGGDEDEVQKTEKTQTLVNKLYQQRIVGRTD